MEVMVNVTLLYLAQAFQADNRPELQTGCLWKDLLYPLRAIHSYQNVDGQQ